ncbi:MAG: hypothetical protein Q4G26_07135 [Paracoccus sp. (in: a-proteobacteria)]|nr:hypothetical protein [Paracoccus sp. (in: a-proteobacteria)]
MKNRKTVKPQSEELKYFEDLLANRINEEYADKDPAEWLHIFDGGPFADVISGMAQYWDEVRALVEALEDSHLDDEYTSGKKYMLTHLLNAPERIALRRSGKGDPDLPVRSNKTRAEILSRLADIANLDFGDDPDEWRRWYKAYDEDDFFPPVR